MKKVFSNNIKLLKYVFKFSPELFYWKFILVILNVIISLFVGVGFMKYLVDAVEQGTSFTIVACWIAGMAILYIINSLISSFYNNYVNYMGKRKIHKGMHNLIFCKIKNVDLEKYDDAKFYNNCIWALNEVDNRTIVSFENFMRFLQCLLSVFSVFVVASMFDMGVLIFGIIPLIVSMVISNKNAVIAYEYQKAINPIERKKEYVKRIFYQKQYAKELKSFFLADVLIEKFNNCIDKSVQLYRGFVKKIIGYTLIQDNSQTVIGMALLSLYLAYKAIVLKSISLGTLTASFNAVNLFTGNLSSAFSIYPKLKENALYAEKVLYILDYQSQIEGVVTNQKIEEPFKELNLINIFFRYSKKDKYILKNINMKIEKGEKIAIVGLNGAGKTTLIKLIMHFYNPNEGQILYNGLDIKQYSTSEYRNKFATIFQDYQLYAVSLLENIFMREVNEEDCAKGKELLNRSCMGEYGSLLQKEVTKEFDDEGIVFSGGQQQKVAIARVLAQNGEIVIMDEASSALNPISENEINKTVIDESDGKSMIIISHRLSTIKYADRIYYMENGEILEQGTHEELMKNGCGYAKMYSAQADKYVTTKNTIQCRGIV